MGWFEVGFIVGSFASGIGAFWGVFFWGGPLARVAGEVFFAGSQSFSVGRAGIVVFWRADNLVENWGFYLRWRRYAV